jgi:type I restriction enzyme S subunit
MSAVDAESGTISLPEERPYGEVRKGYTAFAEGDVIFAKITPCMENGKCTVARGLTNGLGFGSTEFHVLRPRELVLPDYLFHFLRQPCFRDSAAGHLTGNVGQQRLPASFLESAELPLPPLPEQRCIVAKVEELLARVTSAKARLATAKAALARFRQAVLTAACSGGLTEDWRSEHPQAATGQEMLSRLAGASPRRSDHLVTGEVLQNCRAAEEDQILPEEWAWATVEAVSAQVVDCPHSTPNWTESGLICLRTTNFRRGCLDLSEVRYVSHETYVANSFQEGIASLPV